MTGEPIFSSQFIGIDNRVPVLRHLRTYTLYSCLTSAPMNRHRQNLGRSNSLTDEFAQNTGTPQTKHEHAKRSSDHTSKTIAKNNSRTIATIAKKSQKTPTQHRTTPGHAASSSAWMHPQLLIYSDTHNWATKCDSPGNLHRLHQWCVL